ncbi:hypothetical protein GCM10009716_02170 [Streptomyces sodiiphilus]|uniref:Uncharacterized protein n=1 Tax=Streptomyces sodiiphilus TaxID=226217 RepID=A0ABN2NRS9_9ACTN
MKRIRIVLISVGILLGVLALGGIGVAAVNIYQQLNATPDHPPAARPMIPSAPPEADEKKAEQWGDMLRTRAAGADYTMNDAADLDEG